MTLKATQTSPDPSLRDGASVRLSSTQHKLIENRE